MKKTRNQPVNIPVSKLRPFEGHPFKVKDDEEMNTLIESVQTVGILSPLIVRPIESTEEYEVISGHRRLHAAVKAGITEVPALIYALDRDSAAIAVVDSNLHREHILPSEKAFAYKLKMEALNHQGITCGQVGHKSRDDVSDTESGRTVQRYIRLTNLIPELLEFMDESKMALSVGVELSFLDEQSQYDVLEQCDINDCTPSYSQAVEMKKRFQDRHLSTYDIGKIMACEKPNQRETIKIPSARLEGKIPSGYTLQQKEDFIVKAVDHYNKYRARQRDRNSR